MANEFLETELSKISEDKRWAYPLNMAMATTYLLAHYKGENLKIFDMSNVSSLCEFNVIATAQNTMQARSMADEISRHFRNLNVNVLSMEGYGSADWILIDTGDVIIHIFQDSTRDIYELDRVFEAAETVVIPEELYFGSVAAKPAEENLKGFF